MQLRWTTYHQVSDEVRRDNLLFYGGPHSKTCVACLKYKPALEFYWGWRCAVRLNKCIDCTKAHTENHLSKPGKREAKRETVRLRNERIRRETPHLRIVDSAKHRSADKGLPYDLDQYIDALRKRVEPMVCELSGLKMICETGAKTHPRSLSVDRIDSTRGYTYDNIRIICWCLNAAFNNWGDAETYRILYPWFKRLELEQGPPLALAA